MTPGSALVHALRTRCRTALGAVRDRGASALEFAIIAAVVVVASSVIGGVVYNIVKDKGVQLDQCAKQPIGAAGCNTGP